MYAKREVFLLKFNSNTHMSMLIQNFQIQRVKELNVFSGSLSTMNHLVLTESPINFVYSLFNENDRD